MTPSRDQKARFSDALSQNVRSVCAILFLSCLLPACIHSPRKTSFSPITAQEAQQNVAKAVFLHLLQNDAPFFPEDVTIYCLSFNDRDVSDNVLHSLEEYAPNLRMASQCPFQHTTGASPGEYVDERTGQRAALLYIKHMKFAGHDKATAVAGYAIGVLGGHTATYYIESTHGKWVVRRRRITSVA